MDDVLLEYHWLKDVAASETGVDSPFYHQFGDLMSLLANERARLEKARQQLKEIEHKRVPIEGTSWVRLESTHPTADIMDIYFASDSEVLSVLTHSLHFIPET